MGTEEQNPKIIIPEEWSMAANRITKDSTVSPPSKVLICGPKNAGKTTFSRHLLNTLLSRFKKVAYLDTDVGQTEFTPPGLVSLTIVDKITGDLTIPCLKTPQRSFFFGDISSKRAPATYTNHIFALYHFYKEEYCMFNKRENHSKAEVPLIVNTPGWVKGNGYSTLLQLIEKIVPTHIVKVNIPVLCKNLPPGPFWINGDSDGTKTLIEIDSVCRDSFNRSVLARKDARFLREMRIIAYFRQCIPSSVNIPTVKELAHELASHPPYKISMSCITIRHLHCQVPRSEIFYSLNATIVGLTISSEDSELPQCVGLGIVRGVDASKELLYVITPILCAALEKVDLLLQGFIQIPACLLQVAGCMSPYISANALSLQNAVKISNSNSTGSDR